MTTNDESIPVLDGYRTTAELFPWEKVYWYLRVLVDTDRYGALSHRHNKLLKIHDVLMTAYRRLNGGDETVQDKMKILDSVFLQTLLEGVNQNKNTYGKLELLHVRLQAFFIDPRDYYIFAFTVKQLMIPTNEAVKNVPSSEVTDFARKYAKAILDVKGERGLTTLVRDWDTFTEDLALNKERDILMELFEKIKNDVSGSLTDYQGSLSDKDRYVVLTAVCQEYERRVSQKRKQRAGNDLETASEYIFNYFGIPSHGRPAHFSAGIEVDNWIMTNDGWYIGVSLKRTLRERWKQTYTTEDGFYTKYKIKNIIHIINNDSDLSDTKISELGLYHNLFFVADESNVLKAYGNHPVMGKCLFPMSKLIVKIKELIKG